MRGSWRTHTSTQGENAIYLERPGFEHKTFLLQGNSDDAGDWEANDSVVCYLCYIPAQSQAWSNLFMLVNFYVKIRKLAYVPLLCLFIGFDRSVEMGKLSTLCIRSQTLTKYSCCYVCLQRKSCFYKSTPKLKMPDHLWFQHAVYQQMLFFFFFFLVKTSLTSYFYVKVLHCPHITFLLVPCTAFLLDCLHKAVELFITINSPWVLLL